MRYIVPMCSITMKSLLLQKRRMEYAKGDFTKERLKIQRAMQQILSLCMKYL